MSYFTLPYTLSELTLPSRALINGESSGPRDRKHSDTVQCLSYLKVERRRCFSIGFESVASGALKREGGYLSRRQMKEWWWKKYLANTWIISSFGWRQERVSGEKQTDKRTDRQILSIHLNRQRQTSRQRQRNTDRQTRRWRKQHHM